MQHELSGTEHAAGTSNVALERVVRAPRSDFPKGAPMRRRRATVPATLAAFLLAACGSAETDEAASPFEALFGGGDSPAESRAKQLEQEDIVALCMREEGWEYTPVDYSAQFPDQPEEELTGPDYGEKYGYGIARSYELYEWPYLDENGNNSGDGGFGGGFEDPNWEYVSSLSTGEGERYHTALHGDQADAEASVDGEGEGVYTPPPLEEQGCYGKAQLEVYGEQPWNDPAFGERFGDLSQQIENDPRLEDAEIVWSDCMYDISEEYDFFGPMDVHQYVANLFAESKGQEVVEVDPDTGEISGRPGVYAEGGWSSNEDGEAWGYVGTARRLSEDEIRQFQGMEVGVWRDDQGCLDESGYADLRRELEQEIVDTIQEEFPDLINPDDDRSADA